MRVARARAARRRMMRRRRRAGFTFLLLSIIFVTGGIYRHVFLVPHSYAAAEIPAESGNAVVPSESVDGNQPAVLTESSASPSSGPGTFTMAKTQGDILGTAGILKRFRVAVESNVDSDADEFIRAIDSTLGDPRSWIAGKNVRLQRVPDGVAFDFTIYLATRQTAYKLCGQGGLDIRENGIPYTSCQLSGKVVANFDRWRQAVPDYGASIADYRQYMINHEVGHELGHGHESCPGTGQAAPVMQQQTLGLRGCTANSWPYLDGKRYEGQPVA